MVQRGRRKGWGVGTGGGSAETLPASVGMTGGMRAEGMSGADTEGPRGGYEEMGIPEASVEGCATEKRGAPEASAGEDIQMQPTRRLRVVANVMAMHVDSENKDWDFKELDGRKAFLQKLKRDHPAALLLRHPRRWRQDTVELSVEA